MHAWLLLSLMALTSQVTDVEAKIIEYLDTHLEPGRAVVVSDLFNDVFTSPEEQAALDQLYNTFFKIPMFLVEYQARTGQPPSLEQIREQFNFTVPGQTDVMLRVMEADPRIPDFFDRDPETGELTLIDVEAIRTSRQFGQAVERTLTGWEGRPLPPLSAETFDGGQIRSDAVAGRPYLLYVWFSNCPPCMRTSPLLVDLYSQYADSDFEIVALNADRVLGLPYNDQDRASYVEELGIRFPTAHLSADMQNALGGISIFPTLFFVNDQGIVVKHFVNFQERDVLEGAIREALGE